MTNNAKPSIEETVPENTPSFRVFEELHMEPEQRRSKKVTINPLSESEEDSDGHSHGEQDHGSQISLAPVLLPPLPKEKHFILEPAVTLMYISIGLTGAIYQNQLLYQSCITKFHYSDDICAPLLGIASATNASMQVEDLVQPYVANIVMASTLITAIIPAILTLFIGPWSDKYGRRPVILISMFGYFLSSIISIILSVIKTTNPWIFIVSSVPIALTGGSCAMMTVIYCYIADVASIRKRSIRMVLNNSSVVTGGALGTLLSGYILAGTNPATIYGISAVLVALSLAFVYFFAPESVVPNYGPEVSKIKELFHYKLVVDLVKTCTKRRQNAERVIVWLTMVSIVVTYFAQQGGENEALLFLRRQFNVTEKTYKLFSAITKFVQILGGIIGIEILKRIFKMSDIVSSFIAIASLIVQTIVTASAQKFWEMYMGSALGIMGTIVISLLLAIISLIIPVTEVGKVIGLTTALQTISPLIAAPLYTAVYNAALGYYPGLFNIISIALYLLCFGMLATIFGIQKSLGIPIV